MFLTDTDPSETLNVTQTLHCLNLFMQSELFIVFIVREPSQRTPLTFLKHLFVHVFADLTKRKRRLLRSRLLRLGLFYGTFWI